MFRRSRFSVRPNVSTTGRTAATPQEASSANQEASETPKDLGESISGPTVTDNKCIEAPSEKTTCPGDGSEQNGEGTSSSAAVQRRKRFSIKPKVAPGRPTSLARTPKSPVKAVSENPVEVSGSDSDKPVTSSQTGSAASPQGLQFPKRRRPSEDTKQPKVQPKPTPISSDSTAPSAVPPAEDSLEQTHLPTDSGKQLENTSGSQVKEVPPRPPDRVPPFIPDKEAIELSEKAKTLVSSKSGLSLSPSALSLSRLLNDPSDLQRLAKAQKLRELLREERHKERKLKKAKARAREYSLDPAKMTMRDLIRYLPVSNPMTSNLEQSTQENETVVPTSPEREDRSPERAQEPEVLPKIASPREEEIEEEEDEQQEEALMVPQVKVAEDGSLIIDEESLTVEVQRAKGPNPAQDRDPIFERGSTTTYSSFRKGTCPKPWSSEETDMFFLAVSMVGTDFSMICQLFPHRARAEIKNKFKREERDNAWRIDKAFRERRKLDIEYFSKLLEKILEVQKNKKKLKSLAEKNSPKKRRKTKAKGKKATRKLSDVEEEDEEDENQVPDLEDEEYEKEGEKENEQLCNEGGTTASKPKRQQKRKTTQDASNEEPNKKNKMGETSNEHGEACTPEDTEAALPEDPTNSDMSENVNAAKNTAVKPAKLSRGRTPKPLLPLGRKWGKKAPPPSTKAQDTGEESVSDGASKEQIKKDASPSRQDSKEISDKDEISSDEDEAAVPPPRPTRYGRVPKPTKLLTYPCKDDAHSSASETTPASPMGHSASAAKPKPKCTAKRGRSSAAQSEQESKKPKLVTLRATQSDYSDDENEQQWEQEEVEEDPACSPSKDSSAPAFVPASLRSPHPIISVVEETMEELDILANMPDVLGISQDALCPDASCEQAQNETGTAEPCEHQLDLLVDVIDFLSSEQTEVCEDESYNEAAQTLLTIGNLTHLSQATQNQIATQDNITGTTSNNEINQEGEIPSNPAAHEQSDTQSETSEAVASVGLKYSTADHGDMPGVKDSDQICNEQRTGSGTPASIKDDISCTEVKLTEELQERFLNKVESDAGNQSHCFSDVQFEPSLEHGNQETGSVSSSHAATVESGSNNPATSDISTTEPQVEQGSKTDSLLGSHHSASFVTCVEATVGQSASENQNFTEVQFQPTRDQASGTTRSTSDFIECSCNNPVKSDSAVTGSKVGQGSNIDPVHEDSGHSAAFVTPVEDLSVSQKAESEGASTCLSRSRLQKVKPKPNLPQTSRSARSKPQTKDSIEKDSNPSPIPKFHEKSTAEVEPGQTCAIPPEKSTQSTGPATDLIPSLDLGSALTPTEEFSTTEEKNTDVGLFGQVDSSATTIGQSASENQNFTELQFQPTRDQASGTTRSTSNFIECSYNNPVKSDSAVTGSKVGQGSNIDLVHEDSGHPAAFVTPVEELPVSQKEEGEAASTYQSRRGRLQKVKPKPNLPQTSRTVRSRPQVTKQSIEKDSNPTPVPKFPEKTIVEVEPEQTCAAPSEKLTQSTGPAFLPQTANASSKPQSTTDSITHMMFVEKPSNTASRPEYSDNTIAEVEAQPVCSTIPSEEPSQSIGTASTSVLSLELCTTHKPTEESSSTEEQKTDVGFGADSSSESSEPNVSQRRRRFAKVKPNLASSTRTTRSKLPPKDIGKTSEQHHMETSSNITREQQSVVHNSAQTELEPTEKDRKHLTTVHSSLNTELLGTTKSAAAESETSLDITNDKGISSDGIIIATSWVAENRSMLTDSVPENKSGEKSIGDKMSSNTKVETEPSSQSDCKLDMSTTDPKESSHQLCPESGSEEKSQDAAQQCSQTSETNQTSNNKSQSAHSTDESQSESAESSTSLRKAPPLRRGRLIKPRPNLGRSTQPPQPQQVQSTTQAEADSGTCSQGMGASVSQKPVSEHRPDVQEPVEGAIEQNNSHDSPPNDAGSSLGCLTHVIEFGQQDPLNDPGSSLGCLNQVPPTQNTCPEGTQSHPCLTIFPDMLSEQMPSDPDEPFFILSLTEIPVCSSGEVVDSAAEPLSYLPVTDASIQQQSVPGESLVGAGDGSLPDVPVPMSTEESDEMSLINVKDTGPDPAKHIDLIIKNPVDAQESTTVQSPQISETVEKNDDTEIPPATGTGRRAKLQVKPTSARKKEAGKTLNTDTTQDPHHLGSPVQPEASDATAKADSEVVTELQKGSGDQVDNEKKILTCKMDSSSGAQTQTTMTKATSSRSRKPKGCLSSLSETNSSERPPGKAVSKSAKVKAPCEVAKQSSTSPGVVPTPSLTEVHVEHSEVCSDPTPSTSQSIAEVSAYQSINYVESSSIEEEPTSVSQYFLSDIFTEVEEG